MKLSNLESIIIRAATFDDLQKIAEIKIDKQSSNGYDIEAETAIHNLFMREYKKRWEQRLQLGVSTLILSRDDHVYGFVSCSLVSGKQGENLGAIEMTSLYIMPDMRRLGLGSMLCHAALISLQEMDFPMAVVWIPECSFQMMSFYESMGFGATADIRQEVVHNQTTIKEVKHQIDLKSHNFPTSMTIYD